MEIDKVNIDLQLKVNLKLLEKRKEAEKLIIRERSKMKLQAKQKKEQLHQVSKRLDEMQHESSSLTYKSVAISADVAKLKSKIAKLENKVQITLCKIDEIKPRQTLAKIVKEKEEQVLKRYYEDMEERERSLKEYWEESGDETDIRELQRKKQRLVEKQAALEDQISGLRERGSTSVLNKLTEECMVLRKRNTAFLRRETRILEQLERQTAEKKEELTRARHNVTFKFF